MGNHFINKWKEKEKQPGIVAKITSAAKPHESLKDQINVVIQRLDVQTRTLDAAEQRFQNRDREIFNRIVKAMADHDEARANIFATELAEIRKVEKMLMHASLAMQSMSMRLSTVSEVGDLVTILSPAKSVLSNVSSEMCGILPEASQELGNIGNLLGEIVTTTCQGTDVPINVGNASAEALAILEEAEITAEKRLKEKLPEVTTSKPLRTPESLET